MKNSNEEFSRLDRNKKSRSDQLLNWLIGAVIIGIFVVGWVILSPSKGQPEQVEEELPAMEEIILEDELEENELAPIETEDSASTEDDEEDVEKEEIEIIENPVDDFVSSSIIDPAWVPIGTAQFGEHVSLYDGTSVDWKEKEQALLYATELTPDNIIFHKIGNGGSPQKSIGIVSSLDQTDMYRVYLEWIDGEGWKPVQVDILNTLQFNY